MKTGKHQTRGAALVETLVAVPLLLLLGMGLIQWALIYEAKSTLDYATFMAVRAGAVDHASPETIKSTLARSLVPLYSPDKSVQGLGKKLLLANADIRNPLITKLRILNPTQEAFEDFAEDDTPNILPNYRLWQASPAVGGSSGVNIQDANLLKLEVTYSYELKVPYVGRIIAALVNNVNADDGWTVQGKPHSAEWKTLEATQTTLPPRIPILASATVRMQNTAHKNSLMVSRATGKAGDYSDLNIAGPIDPLPPASPKPTSQTPGDGHPVNFITSDPSSISPGDDDGSGDDDSGGDDGSGDDSPAECEQITPEDDDQGAEPEDQSIWGKLWNDVKSGLVEGYQFVKGFWEGIKSQISDLADILANPGDFVRGLIELGKQFVKEPIKTAKMIASVFGDDLDTLVHCGSYDRGRILGEYISPAFIIKLATKLAKFEKLADALKATKRDFGCASFAAGTQILTPAGTVNIEALLKGQQVSSRNEHDFADVPQAVINTFNRTSPHYYQLTTEYETIQVTEEHPLWKQGKGWTEAKDLKMDDVLASVDGDILILNNQKVDEPLRVYNFSVEKTPSYFAGESKVWVHNAPCEFELINGVRYIKVTIDSLDGKNKALNNPQALTIYNVNGRHVYKTDKHGRVESVTSTVRDQDLDTSARNYYQQCKIGKCGIDGDEGGHLIATKLGGPGEAINLVPQNFNLNRGKWRSMEREWGIAASEGKTVDIEIKPVYTGDSKRPDSFIVKTKIDGVRQQDRRFVNQAGG